MYITKTTTLKPGMANNKRIYARRPKIIDNRYIQLSLFTDNGDAIRFLPVEDVRQVFNEFAYAVNSHSKQLYRFAFSLTKNTYDAEELVQNTIERALLKRETVKGSLIGWLQNTCKWLFLNQCRTKKNSLLKLTGESVKDSGRLYEDNAGINTVALQEAKNMLSFLTDGERELAEMKFLQGMQYNEIAEDLNKPVGTVKSKLYFIRKILKQQLKKYRE